jgi:uncharacterized membrane protein
MENPMKLQIRIFLSGALVVVPLAITVYVIISVGAWMDGLGRELVKRIGWDPNGLFSGAGAILLLGVIYIAGLLTHVWGFRPAWSWFERVVSRLPGVKIIYESVRDLMKLFGGGAGSMCRAVEYRPAGSEASYLGIVTNENPAAAEGGPKRVAVYLPLAYMFGGPTVLTSPENLRDLKITVEHALKLAATAHMGAPVPDVPVKEEEKS